MTADAWTTTSVPYLTPRAPGEPDAWTARGGLQQLIRVGIIEAPAEVRDALGLAVGAHVVERLRMMADSRGPYELVHSWWPTSIAAGTPLASDKRIKGGTVRVLADLGYTVDDSIEDVSAQDAGELAVEHLFVAHGSSVLRIERVRVSAGRRYEFEVMTRRKDERQRYMVKAG